MAQITRHQNPVGIASNHLVDLAAGFGKADADIEFAADAAKVPVEIEQHRIAVGDALLDDGRDFMGIPGSNRVIPKRSRVVPVIVQRLIENIERAAAAQARIRLVIAPDGDTNGNVLKALERNFTQAVCRHADPEVLREFLDAMQCETRLTAHNGNEVRSTCFLPLDEGLEQRLVLWRMMPVHLFRKKITAGASNVARVREIQRDRSERPRVANLCVETIEKRVFEILFQAGVHNS